MHESESNPIQSHSLLNTKKKINNIFNYLYAKKQKGE